MDTRPIDDASLSGIKPREYVHHVSFRLSDRDAALAADLRSTFPNNTWAETYRWLMSNPEVIAIIHRRIRGER